MLLFRATAPTEVRAGRGREIVVLPVPGTDRESDVRVLRLP